MNNRTEIEKRIDILEDDIDRLVSLIPKESKNIPRR